MPSIIIHRCVSKRLLEKIDLFEAENDKYLYDVGSAAPDSWRNTKRFKDSSLPKKDKRKYSHFSNDGEFIENYDWFYDKYKDNLDNPFMVGYLVHLITDNFWRYDMFYKSFYPDGAVKMIDNSVLNMEKHEKKELLHEETKEISGMLADYFGLGQLRPISEEEISSLPIMDEIEYDGINDTINYNNKELASINTDKYELKVFKENDFIEGIDRCCDFISSELRKYGIIKDNRLIK